MELNRSKQQEKIVLAKVRIENQRHQIPGSPHHSSIRGSRHLQETEVSVQCSLKTTNSVIHFGLQF
jgi:hypothetical protein